MNPLLFKPHNHPTLEDRVLQAIEQHDLVPDGTGILAGVSGGPDSMVLLHLLHRLSLFPLRVAHLNHLLRPSDSDADEALVRDYCDLHSIEYVSRTWDVAAFASQFGLGIEAAGRICRHQFFSDCSQQWKQEQPSVRDVRIALAHHLDDQAETILLHLGRGCGLAGLAGMTPKSGPFIRPLLGVRRTEIHAYLDRHHVPFRLDTTNKDPFTLRNRLRLHLLPAWQDALGYDPAPALARMASLAGEDQDYLDREAERAWLSAVRQEKDHAGSAGTLELASVCLDRDVFHSEHPAIQNRLLRLAWRKVSGQNRDIEWRHLNLARSLILEKRSKGHLDWPQGVSLDLDDTCVHFSQTEKSRSDINSLHKVAYETRFHDDRLI